MLFTYREIERLSVTRGAVENCLLWSDGAFNWTFFGLVDAVQNNVQNFDDIDFEEEYRLTPVGLSEDGEAELRAEPYWVVDKETGDISEDDMYRLAVRVLGIDVVSIATQCDSSAEWRERIDDAICRAMLDNDRLIEFRTAEEATDWVAENLPDVFYAISCEAVSLANKMRSDIVEF